MKTTVSCKMKSYIQPFERKLALAELSALTEAEPRPLPTLEGEPLEFEVETDVPACALAERLAYWEHIQADRGRLTRQVLREATVYAVRNGVPVESIPALVAPNRLEAFLPNRRCLRYGTHGIHEYRGKYFPQLVRALINIARVPPGGIVADPMSGSGTTLVEGVLSGYRAFGLDMNPLSVLMSRVKCGLLACDPRDLVGAYEAVREQLLKGTGNARHPELPYLSTLPERDQQYLSNWFAEEVLWELDRIASAIGSIPSGVVQDFLWLGLSNILRAVSWQKDSDLRVRKEIRPDADIDPIREFLEEVGRSVRSVVSLLYADDRSNLGVWQIEEGDARRIADRWGGLEGSVDAIITSPPYATALPYLDTDRLSLIFLGLLPRADHNTREAYMIGTREITEKRRREQWEQFQQNRHLLPPSVVSLIEEIERLNATTKVGFRRRNLPSLLARYFLDMREVLKGMAKVLKPGAPAFVVVGNNHTVAGGRRIDIETARFLAEIAETVGFSNREHINMDMLVSRDIFKKNAVASEVILELRRVAA